MAVARGDPAVLAKVYGVGKKSAERIVVELRDRLAREVEERGSEVGAPRTVEGEVMEALQAVGYSVAESRDAVRSLPKNTDSSVRERLAEALKRLGSNK